MTSSPAAAATCAERLPAVSAKAESRGFTANRNIALKRIEEARAALQAGDEDGCLLYLRAAQNALEQPSRGGGGR